MGFISAVKDLGELEIRKFAGSRSDELDNYLQLPLPMIQDEERAGKVIRIWLDVDDPAHAPLDVKEIYKIDLVDYMPGALPEEEQKRRYLYRDPVGSNVNWSFSPIYKLGKAESDAANKLAGEDFQWELDKKSRFYKMKHRVLADFENEGVFTKGSTELIMEALVSQVNKISELWSNKKCSYLLLFGIYNRIGNLFLYPGDIASFKDYFKKKLKFSLTKSASSTSGKCSICGEGGPMLNIDKIFKFATFDKISFLPGANGEKGSEEKVFPVGESCFAALSRGREVLDGSFLDVRTISGIKIYVIPELLLGINKLGMVSQNTQNFIKGGISVEKQLFRKLARQDNSLVFHFLFWEKNQAQERLHLMIEDVPPSHLKRLEALWSECHKIFLEDNPKGQAGESENATLDQGIRTTYGALSSLAGKSDQDKSVMKERTLGILGRLLGGDQVDVREVKQLMVSRFPGLFSDSKWLRFGGRELRKMAAVLDFLSRSNGR